ncbi:MAG: deoxyribodipyrimidine photolyase [Planctomycetota bacterium]
MVPSIRIRPVNAHMERPERPYVLYWMTAARRLRDNFGLQRAAERARALGKPLAIFEALRSDYPWRSERIDGFVLAGMREKAQVEGYLPYVGSDSGVLARLASDAALVVTDDYPCFFLPRMTEAAGKRLDVRLEAVDSNGLLPMRAADREFTSAHSFRRFLHKELLGHLNEMPDPNPLTGVEPARIPWSFTVPEVESPGGSTRGEARWTRFLDESMDRYDGRRVTSGLSAYLHFGHLGVHTMFRDLANREGWEPRDVLPPHNGRRAGWWGMGEAAERFVDQFVTWRELGFNCCYRRTDFDQYESLPAWARTTLEDHAGDERDYLYSLEEFEASATHDLLWNAAQRQLVRDGTIQSYLRMLWGKKILEWSGSPREALSIMIELNNRYALDGRDPNSYSGIFWTLGRYDRAWGPERPVYGKIRFMSSANSARKLPLRAYMEQYA